MLKIWNSLRKPLIIIVLFLLISFFGIYIFSSPRITGDAASHLLLAVSPILKIGAPYKDFWDIKPPMMPLALFVWSKIFGFGIFSIRIINILLPTVCIFLIHFLYKRIFKTPVFEIIFLSTILILLSPFLHSIMLPTEILGLTFSLSALIILIVSKNNFIKYFFSGLLFFFASQSKEPFTFTVLATLPIFAYSFLEGGVKKMTKNILIFLFGIAAGFVVIVSYLNLFNSYDSYKEVFVFKSLVYKFTYENLSRNFSPGIVAAEITFTEIPLGMLILAGLSIISLILINKYNKLFSVSGSQLAIKSLNLLDNKIVTKLAAVFYAVGSFVGFGLGNSFGSHYLIQVVVPFYMISGLFVLYIFNSVKFLSGRSKKRFWISLFIFLFSIIVILPKRQYLKSYIPEKVNLAMTDEVYDSEKRVTEITTKDQCVLSVYGWGVGENYLYSKRRPCTRYFLPNITIKDWQREEYRKSIQENPPAAIIYQTNDSDMDINKFESEVINISKIVENCYKTDIKVASVFVPKDAEFLKDCVLLNSF